MTIVLNADGDAADRSGGFRLDSRSRRRAASSRSRSLVREQQDRLGDVADLALDEARLVVLDQRDDVAAGNVAEVDDREAVRIEWKGDVGNRAGRDRRANRAPVEQVRKRQVVDVSRGTGDLVSALLARDVASDGLKHSGL